MICISPDLAAASAALCSNWLPSLELALSAPRGARSITFLKHRKILGRILLENEHSCVLKLCCSYLRGEHWVSRKWVFHPGKIAALPVYKID